MAGEVRTVAHQGPAAGSGRRRVDVGEQAGLDGCRRHGSCRFGHCLHFVLGQPLLPAHGVATKADRLGYSVIWFATLWPAFLWHPSGSLAVKKASGTPRTGRFEPGAAGGTDRQSHPVTGSLFRVAERDCLKLRKINHLQRATGVTHYRGLPRMVARV